MVMVGSKIKPPNFSKPGPEPVNTVASSTDGADYIVAQQAAADALPAAGTPWLDASRDKAKAILADVGLPTTRLEDWKYTNTRSITRSRFDPVLRSESWSHTAVIEQLKVPELNSHRLVFADGIFEAGLSSAADLPRGVRVMSMAQLLQSEPEYLKSALGSALPESPHGFTAMNSSFISDGAFVEIGAEVMLDKPIELLFVSACSGKDRLGLPRNLVLCRSGGSATVVERYLSATKSRSLTNVVTEVVLDGGARLNHYRVVDESADSFHVGGLFAQQDQSSRLDACSVVVGGGLVRNDVLVNLNAPGAAVDLTGLYLGRGRSHVDNHTHVVPHTPEGTSREHYKGILDDRSRAVFHGRITVGSGAQQTDSEQSNQNLLLSRDAEVDTKPQLEIYADDVKCAHGVTVGQLDENAVFYLRARGVGEDEARKMLTLAFAADVLAKIEQPALKSYLEHCVSDLLLSVSHTS